MHSSNALAMSSADSVSELQARLRELEGAARKALGTQKQRFSYGRTAADCKELRKGKPPHAKRISEWMSTGGPIPRDFDQVWMLVLVWSRYANQSVPDQGPWQACFDAAQRRTVPLRDRTPAGPSAQDVASAPEPPPNGSFPKYIALAAAFAGVLTAFIAGFVVRGLIVDRTSAITSRSFNGEVEVVQFRVATGDHDADHCGPRVRATHAQLAYQACAHRTPHGWYSATNLENIGDDELTVDVLLEDWSAPSGSSPLQLRMWREVWWLQPHRSMYLLGGAGEPATGACVGSRLTLHLGSQALPLALSSFGTSSRECPVPSELQRA